jgi:hypothetical protein
MRCVGGVVAASVLAAGCLFGVKGALADAAADGKHVDRYLLFGGFDLWRNGGFAHGGLLWSPGGLAREGFTLKLLVAGGRYRYLAGGTEIAGRQALGSVLGGWRFVRDKLEVTLFAGPDLQSHRLTPDDPGNRMRGSHGGLRVGADLWYQPSEAFMATASVSASTIGPNYWSRGAIGWRLFERVWFGPELLALGGDRYHQFRAGIHATAVRTLAFEWSAGVGYTRDSDDRNGIYTRIGVLTRR